MIGCFLCIFIYGCSLNWLDKVKCWLKFRDILMLNTIQLNKYVKLHLRALVFFLKVQWNLVYNFAWIIDFKFVIGQISLWFYVNCISPEKLIKLWFCLYYWLGKYSMLFSFIWSGLLFRPSKTRYLMKFSIIRWGCILLGVSYIYEY